MSMQPSPPVRYSKPWLSLSDQVAQLRSRGLVINDTTAAERFLSHVNYYRLSGYCFAFAGSGHTFNAGTTFEQIRDAYHFDLGLRDIVTEALELIEVDVRSNIAHHTGRAHGAFGHTDSSKFFVKPGHLDWLSRLRKETGDSKDQFVSHFRRTYHEFPDLPIWVVTELMTFGQLSKMVSYMDRKDQKSLAGRYGLNPGDFIPWLHHISYVRNICAHHARLWDRSWAIKPTLLASQWWKHPHLGGNDKLFVTVLILYRLLQNCPAVDSFATDWRERLHRHLDSPPATPNPLERMGLTATWKSNRIWQ